MRLSEDRRNQATLSQKKKAIVNLRWPQPIVFIWSGRLDSNQRPLRPERSNRVKISNHKSPQLSNETSNLGPSLSPLVKPGKPKEIVGCFSASVDQMLTELTTAARPQLHPPYSTWSTAWSTFSRSPLCRKPRNMRMASFASSASIVLYLSNISLVLWPVICIMTDSGTPAFRM